MQTVAIVGAGVMGSDLAMNCAAAGYKVILKDVERYILDDVKNSLPRKLREYKIMSPALKEWNVKSIIENIVFTTDYDLFKEAEWVIESVPEEWQVKQRVYMELKEVCNLDTFFAVNTSCFPITRVAALMPFPERVIGAHFMNPVPLKTMVEVIRAYQTSESTVDAMKSFLSSLGKSAAIVKDFPGFVSNRLSHLFMNEAAFLVQDQVASPAIVDAIFREGYGHKMGPLETADLIGLDTVVKSLDVLYQNYQDSKFRCCPLLRQMVDAGITGKKSGKGFYEYSK